MHQRNWTLNEVPYHVPILYSHLDALQVPNQMHKVRESALCRLNLNMYCPIVTGACHDALLFRLRIK